MLRLFLLLSTALIILSFQNKPYAGQQNRSIKSLSPQTIKGYLNGEGMGLAKAAELNHYPGPRHVLDLAQDLHLTPEQIIKSEALYQQMKQEAVATGKRLIQAERTLDSLFITGTITENVLRKQLENIGQLQAGLRFIHLKAHLAQKAILSEDQITHYDKLRGYGKNGGHHHDHRHHSQHGH